MEVETIPDLRLGQLLLNMQKPGEDDIYNVEDDEMLKRIHRYPETDEVKPTT